MNRSLLLAGLMAAFVSTGALAQRAPFESPSPTIVYCDLVTIGSAPTGELPADLWPAGNGGRG